MAKSTQGEPKPETKTTWSLDDLTFLAKEMETQGEHLRTAMSKLPLLEELQKQVQELQTTITTISREQPPVPPALIHTVRLGDLFLAALSGSLQGIIAGSAPPQFNEPRFRAAMIEKALATADETVKRAIEHYGFKAEK